MMIQSGTLWLYLIPLMPFGWMECDRPEAARMFLTIVEFDFTPGEDLAKAAAYSLRRSNLFKDAFFTFGGGKDKADYILTGKIIAFLFKLLNIFLTSASLREN
jgi:hypothetical protein